MTFTEFKNSWVKGAHLIKESRLVMLHAQAHEGAEDLYFRSHLGTGVCVLTYWPPGRRRNGGTTCNT